MTIGDDELTERMLGYVVETPRKAARVIMSVLWDVGHEVVNERLYGFGETGPETLLDRCIALLKTLASTGRIEAAGDLDRPRYSEIWLKAVQA